MPNQKKRERMSHPVERRQRATEDNTLQFQVSVREQQGLPVVFTTDAWRDYDVGRLTATLTGVEYRCLLYGTIEPTKLVVHLVVGSDLLPLMRRVAQQRIQEENLVLLGESHEPTRTLWRPTGHPKDDPYLYLTVRRIEGISAYDCKSVQNGTLVDHTVWVRRYPPEQQLRVGITPPATPTLPTPMEASYAVR